MSDNLNELAAALAKAQSKITSPPKNREVEVKLDSGGKYKFRYTTLDALIEHVREPLTTNGLWFTQSLGTDAQGRATLTTTLLHSSGQRIDGTMPIPAADGKNKIQAFGSAVTYMKRYALAALLGLASDEDDDGNAHDGNEVRDTTPQRATSAKTPAQAKRDGDFEKLQAEIDSCEDVTALGSWWKNNQHRIKALPDRKDGPGSWVDLITEHKDKRKAEIEAAQRLRDAAKRQGIPADADHPMMDAAQ